MRTLVIGLGREGVSDAAVGLKLARLLRLRVSEGPALRIAESISGGASLVDEMMGYERVIVLDGIRTDGGVPGHFSRLSVEHYRDSLHATDRNGLAFGTAVALGLEKARSKMPGEIIIFAIEIDDFTSRNGNLTPKVEKALPRILKAIESEL